MALSNLAGWNKEISLKKSPLLAVLLVELAISPPKPLRLVALLAVQVINLPKLLLPAAPAISNRHALFPKPFPAGTLAGNT